MNRIKLIAAFAGYGLWFVLLYLLMTWLTFPWSRVEDHAIVAASDAGWALDFDDVGSALFGVWAEGIKLRPASSDENEDGDDRSGLLGVLLGDGIVIDEARIKVPMTRLPGVALMMGSAASKGGTSPFDLLNAAGRVDLDMSFWGGTFGLDLQSSSESNRIELDAQGISLDDWVLRTGFVSADPQGTLRSKGTITWHKEDPKKSSGGMDLFLDSLTIPGLPIVGDVAFSKSEGHIKLSRGRAEIRDTSLEADEVQAVVEGFVTLSKNLERSRLSLKLRFKVREDIDPLVNGAMMGNTRHKDGDGWYHYQISGTLSKPRFRPSAAAAQRGKRKPPVSRAAPSAAGDEDEAEDRERVRSNNPDRIERNPVSKEDREDAEVQRERLREERATRREERKLRREEMMRKRRERQDELGRSGGRGLGLDNEAFLLPDDIVMPGSDEQEEDEGLEPGEGELEGEGGEFEEEGGEFEED